MKKYLFAACCAVSLFFSSCETDATIDPPKSDPKLVVYCYISPQDLEFKAIVRMSSPVFSNSNPVNPEDPVTNATVTVTGASGSVQLTYDSNREAYFAPASSLAVLAGQTYSISVTTPDGKSATASTTVPSPMPVVNYNFSKTTYDSTSSGYYRDYELDMNWNDISGETNYYRVLLMRRLRQGFTGDTVMMMYSQTEANDASADGQRINGAFDWSDYTQTQFSSGSDSTLDYRCYAYSVNEAYYRFHVSLRNYNGDNPFAEPALTYSNMTGGFGVFAAFNGSETIFLP